SPARRGADDPHARRPRARRSAREDRRIRRRRSREDRETRLGDRSMRRAATVLVVALAVVVVAVAAIDVIGPAGGLTPGSASAIISRDGLTLAADTPCARPPAQCPARYAFAPGRVMTLWFAVRNAGALDLTVDGIDDWVRSLPADPLVRPIDVLDGGDVARGFEDVSTPFVRLVLHPGDQRLSV